MSLGLDQGWIRSTGKLRRGAPKPEVSRLNSKSTKDGGPPVPEEHLFKVVDALDEVAKETGKSVPQIALNWVLSRPGVSNVIVGGGVDLILSIA